MRFEWINKPMQNLNILFKSLAIVIITSLSILSTDLQSEVYKWVDENGKVHYSDKPFDNKSKKVKIKSTPSKQQVEEAKSAASRLIKHKNKITEIMEEEQEDKRKHELKFEQNESKRKRECRQAKNEIRKLGRGYRSYTTNEKGERYFLSDKEKEDMIAKFSEFMQLNCSGLTD